MRSHRSPGPSWSGVFPYLPTPTARGGSLDLPLLADIATDCVSAGVHGLTLFGSAGEAPYFSMEDRIAAVETVVSAAPETVPVVVGICGFDSRSLVEQATEFSALGVDGILLIPLRFFHLSEANLQSMISAVAAATSGDLVLYNHPHLTGVDIGVTSAASAFRNCGVRYIKESSGDIARIAAIREATAGGMTIFSATAVPPSAAMLMGAAGWMSAPAAVFPREAIDIYELCRSGNWAESVAANSALEGALRAFRSLGPSRGIRALFAARGLPIGDPPEPLSPLTADEIDAVRKDCMALIDVREGPGSTRM